MNLAAQNRASGPRGVALNRRVRVVDRRDLSRRRGQQRSRQLCTVRVLSDLREERPVDTPLRELLKLSLVNAIDSAMLIDPALDGQVLVTDGDFGA